MRGCGLTLGCAGLVLGYIAAGTGIATTLAHLVHQAELTWRAAANSPKGKDALADELARCQKLGIGDPNDEGCEAAWAESRRRFLDYGTGIKRTDMPPTTARGH